MESGVFWSRFGERWERVKIDRVGKELVTRRWICECTVRREMSAVAGSFQNSSKDEKPSHSRSDGNKL